MHSVVVAGRFGRPDVELIRIPGRNTGCVQQCWKLHSQTKKGDVILLHTSDVLHAIFEFQGQFPCLCIAHDKGHYQAQSEVGNSEQNHRQSSRFVCWKACLPAGKFAVTDIGNADVLIRSQDEGPAVRVQGDSW